MVNYERYIWCGLGRSFSDHMILCKVKLVEAWMRRCMEDSGKWRIRNEKLNQSDKEDFMTCRKRENKFDWGNGSGMNGE